MLLHHIVSRHQFAAYKYQSSLEALIICTVCVPWHIVKLSQL